MRKLILPATVLAYVLASCGQTTTQTTAQTTATHEAAPVAQKAAVEVPADINELLNKHTCLTCHAATEKIVGPAYTEVAKLTYTDEQIVALIKAPKPEHWPDYPPMAPLPNVPDEDALKIAAWINSLN